MSVRPKRGGPTALDVARLAGVAPATAARVLGNYGSVSPGVREKVLDAAATLRYRPNRVARSMVTGLTQTLGVVIANIQDEFFARIVRGISDASREVGFDVVLMNSDEDVVEEARAVRALIEKQVDGLIVSPSSPSVAEHLIEVRESGLPIVLLDRTVEGLDVDAVVIDGVEAARAAVTYLLEMGHRHVAVVTDIAEGTDIPRTQEPSSLVTTGARLGGYLNAITDAGFDIDEALIGHAAPSVEGARKTIHAVLKRSTPTAIFTTDDIMTLGVLEGLQEMEVEIPKAISLFGFDDLEWTKVTHPPLSVVAQPMYDLGVTAARSLLARVQGLDEEPRTHILPTHLVLRGSVGPPAA